MNIILIVGVISKLTTMTMMIVMVMVMSLSTIILITAIDTSGT